ncbi:MAG: hypothetical protein IIA45_11870 [Bacteroidetes bacterium]|nr:hypothetical protein [Bacteroidota bacterium]
MIFDILILLSIVLIAGAVYEITQLRNKNKEITSIVDKLNKDQSDKE